MLKFLTSMFVAAAAILSVAQAQPITWKLRGEINMLPSSPEISAFVDFYSPVQGTLIFEDAVPGHKYCSGSDCVSYFDIRTAVIDLQIGRLSVSGVGYYARIWPNQDGFNFDGILSSSDIPGMPLSGTWEIGVDASAMGAYVGFDHLPSTPPSCNNMGWCADEYLDVRLTNGDWHTPDHVGAYYTFYIERVVPEPTPLALYFGLGVILISIRRLRALLGSATRKLVAPSPLALSRDDDTP